MHQILGRVGFSTVSLVQLPGGGWPARKSCPQTPDNQLRINLELHLLDWALKDHVANIIWALSTHTDNQQVVSVLTWSQLTA